MSDVVRITGLRVPTVIGVHAWEQKLTRELVLDLELGVDAKAAAKTDAIADAVDYQAVADAALAFGKDSKFALVETFAEQLAARIKKDFGVKTVRIRVEKPGAVAGAQSVGLAIER